MEIKPIGGEHPRGKDLFPDKDEEVVYVELEEEAPVEPIEDD